MINNLADLSKQLFLSEDKQHLLLNISAIEGITAALLIRTVQHSPYAAMKINPKGIQQAIECITKLNNQQTLPQHLYRITIAEKLNAQLTITMDSLKLSATAEITSAYAGLPITLDQLAEKVKALNISYGLSKKMLHLLIQKAKKAPSGTLYQATIAKGKAPVDGSHASFQRLVEIPSERIMQPQVQENGRVNMRELGKFITVSPGTPLMRKIPHQEGQPGLTVTGEPIKQLIGEDIAFEIGAHTELAKDDNNLLVASVMGIANEVPHGMRVDNALIIENVDVGSGNIDYEGDIIIAENICEGMSVKATGNITVAGFIESANIDCNGNLFVGKGVIGRKTGTEEMLFSCNIRCTGSVSATYSQYANIYTGKDLNIKNQLSHCIVDCLGHIEVKDETNKKGSILGGQLSARHGITAVTIGSQAGIKTTIDLTGLYPHLIETKKKLEVNLPKEKEKLHSVFETQQMIASAPVTEKRKAIDKKLLLLQKESESALIKLEKAQEQNIIALQHYQNQSKLLILQKLYSHIIVKIGAKVFISEQDKGPTCLNLENDQLRIIAK